MAHGRVNSPGSARTAREVLAAFGGSWHAVEEASRVDERGVRILRRSDIEKARRQLPVRG